jgi:hypothetical protein
LWALSCASAPGPQRSEPQHKWPAPKQTIILAHRVARFLPGLTITRPGRWARSDLPQDPMGAFLARHCRIQARDAKWVGDARVHLLENTGSARQSVGSEAFRAPRIGSLQDRLCHEPVRRALGRAQQKLGRARLASCTIRLLKCTRPSALRSFFPLRRSAGGRVEFPF